MSTLFGSYGTMDPLDGGDPSFRTINLNMESNTETYDREKMKLKFGTNSVSTAKYTAISFLPM
jgi:hypothetical protein